MLAPVRTYALRSFRELRIVASDDPLPNDQIPFIKLMKGDKGGAEIFGRELSPEIEIKINQGSRLALYTWRGCTVQVRGTVSQEYEAPDNAMKEYLNVASAIDAQRELAAINGEDGPRVLVTGSPSSGKSSVCLILLNYALRNGWTPFFVEADPRGSTDKDSLCCYPGVISSFVYQSPDYTGSVNQLNYLFGHVEIEEDLGLYYHINRCIASAIDSVMEKNFKVQPQGKRADESQDFGKFIKASGIVINAPYQASQKVICKLVELYKITTVLVIDNPSLNHVLNEAFSDKAAQPTSQVVGGMAFTLDLTAQEPVEEPVSKLKTVILGLSKLEGALSVDNQRIKYIKDAIWRRYFGLDKNAATFGFHVVRFKLSQVKFVTIESNSLLGAEALPTDQETSNEIVTANIWAGMTKTLVNTILGIVATTELELVPFANVQCFVHLKSVEDIPSDSGNEEHETVGEILCPCTYTSSNLPPFFLVPGTLRTMKWL